MAFGFIKFCKNLFVACTMIKKFVVACHVSTIPKSPPKIIRENTYTDQQGQFFLRILASATLERSES